MLKNRLLICIKTIANNFLYITGIFHRWDLVSSRTQVRHNDQEDFCSIHPCNIASLQYFIPRLYLLVPASTWKQKYEYKVQMFCMDQKYTVQML
jgi:hypothetical protein